MEKCYDAKKIFCMKFFTEITAVNINIERNLDI